MKSLMRFAKPLFFRMSCQSLYQRAQLAGMIAIALTTLVFKPCRLTRSHTRRLLYQSRKKFQEYRLLLLYNQYFFNLHRLNVYRIRNVWLCNITRQINHPLPFANSLSMRTTYSSVSLRNILEA